MDPFSSPYTTPIMANTTHSLIPYYAPGLTKAHQGVMPKSAKLPRSFQPTKQGGSVLPPLLPRTQRLRDGMELPESWLMPLRLGLIPPKAAQRKKRIAHPRLRAELFEIHASLGSPRSKSP